MANIIPMAGLGSRFDKEGYVLPKPLIPVSGIPMVIKSIRDMPKSNKWIFIVRQEHIDNYSIDKILKKEIPNAIIIPVEKTTEGQACTCMLAAPYLDENESVFIAACDNGYLFNEKKYNELQSDKSIDCIVWTFTKRETLKRNPAAWGWCKLAEDGITIKNMSVKIPISEEPYNDHAVVASFFFSKARDFIAATNLMISENYRINNEFYIDALPIFLNKLNKRSVIFDVDHYLGWGTPKDLYNYQKLEYYNNNGISPKNISKENEGNIKLWEQYFKK
jgi:dTDP-glucose pyrophosphorylase